MLRLAERVVKERWSARYLENYVNELKNVSSESKANKIDITKPKFIKQQERQLREQYGTKVDISIKRPVGKISFEFGPQEDFVGIIEQLNRRYGK